MAKSAGVHSEPRSPVYPAGRRHYQDVFPPSGGKDVALLDLCSSWISHYPPGYTAGRIAGDNLPAPPALTPIINQHRVCCWPWNAEHPISHCPSIAGRRSFVYKN